MCNYNQAFQGNHSMKGNCGPRGEHFRKMAAMYGKGMSKGLSNVPVNVNETDTSYDLSVFAPARDKSLFSITTKDKVLTIAYNAPEPTETQQAQWARQEYAPVSFERQFLLNGKIDEAHISAQYTEGVLKVTLPKTAEAQRPPQDIQVQ